MLDTTASRQRLDTIFIGGDAATPSLHRLVPALRRWFDHLRLDERDRYLSEAEDHADFGRRVRAWDRYEQSRARIDYLP
jgi:hypothetical protein